MKKGNRRLTPETEKPIEELKQHLKPQLRTQRVMKTWEMACGFVKRVGARGIVNMKSVEYPQIQPFRKSARDYHAVETMPMMLSASFVLR